MCLLKIHLSDYIYKNIAYNYICIYYCFSIYYILMIIYVNISPCLFYICEYRITGAFSPTSTLFISKKQNAL